MRLISVFVHQAVYRPNLGKVDGAIEKQADGIVSRHPIGAGECNAIIIAVSNTGLLCER